MIPMMQIEITIPVLNEENTIEAQVYKIVSFIKDNLSDIVHTKIIIADNGSTDNTPVICRRLEQIIGELKYIRIEKRGVGLALKTSWKNSTADIIGYMDLDLATDLIHLRPTIQMLRNNEADIVAGSRLSKASVVIGRSVIRNITSRSFNGMIKMIFKNNFSDGMCGFKFMKRKCFDDLYKTGAQSDGWFFATELLVAGEFLGYRIYDMPVRWVDDPDSKVKIIKLAMEYIKGMRALKHKLLQNKIKD